MRMEAAAERERREEKGEEEEGKEGGKRGEERREEFSSHMFLPELKSPFRIYFLTKMRTNPRKAGFLSRVTIHFTCT